MIALHLLDGYWIAQQVQKCRKCTCLIAAQAPSQRKIHAIGLFDSLNQFGKLTVTHLIDVFGLKAVIPDHDLPVWQWISLAERDSHGVAVEIQERLTLIRGELIYRWRDSKFG